jgi:thiamine transport system permease protein
MKRIGLWAGPLLFVAALFYWPLANILGEGLGQDWLRTFAEPRVLSAIWFTVWQAVLSTAICILLGIPGAYVLYRKKFRGQKLLRAIITVPLVLPTIVVAISFASFRSMHEIYRTLGLDLIVDVFVDNPIYWIIVAHVFVNYSIAVRTIGGVWVTMDNETEEAAELAGAGRLRTLVSITLPQLKPAVVSAAALIFLFCATSYGIILILGGGLVHSVETEIASAATQFLDLPKAAALAIMQTLLTVAAFTYSENITKGAIGIEQVDEGNAHPPLDKRDWLATTITFVTIGFLTLMPILVVLARAFVHGDGGFGLENFANLSGRGDRDLLNISVGQAALNTLRNVSISTLIAVTLGTLSAYLLSRPIRGKNLKARKFVNRVIDISLLLPMGISSVVLGFGFLISFGGGPLPLRSSWLIVPLVQALMALPLVIRLIYPALVSIGSDHREAASTAGANARQTWWHIESRMIRTVIVTAIGYALVVSIGEFGAASLLAYGDQATLPTVLYALISRPGSTNYGMAMAVTAILILLTFALVSAVTFRKKPRRHSSRSALS